MTSRNALIVRGGWDGHQPVRRPSSSSRSSRRTASTCGSRSRRPVYADADYLATVDLIVQVNTMNTIEKEEFAGPAARRAERHGHGGLARRHRRLVPQHLRLPAHDRRPVRPPRRQATRPAEGRAVRQLHPLHREHHRARRRRIRSPRASRTSTWSPSSTGCCTTTTTTCWRPRRSRCGRGTPGTARSPRRRSGRGLGQGPHLRLDSRPQLDILRGAARAHDHREGACCGRPADDMSAPLRVGMIGVGIISKQYFESLARLRACSSRRSPTSMRPRGRCGRGRAAASPRARSTSCSLGRRRHRAQPDDPRRARRGRPARARRGQARLRREAARRSRPPRPRPLIEAAAAAGVRVGCAPDTVLGTGIQTARRVIDDGPIGEALGASRSWSAPGHERWHPAPDFYYQPGGGPLYDMGPYYLTSLVHSARARRAGLGRARRSARERVIATGSARGHRDTGRRRHARHRAARARIGRLSTVTVSFEVWATRGAAVRGVRHAGTLAVPDPNRFSESVEVFTATSGEWAVVPESAGWPQCGPRLWPRRHGRGDRGRHAAPRLRRASVPRARHHGVDPHRLGVRPGRSAVQQGRAAGGRGAFRRSVSRS